MSYIYDTAYLNVCNFHYILIVIKMHDGEVEVYDSLTKPAKDYKHCFDMLKR